MAGQRNADLEINIKAEAKDAVKGFKDVEKAAAEQQKAIQSLGKAAGVAFAAVSAGLVWATKEAINAEEVDRRLDTQLKKLGYTTSDFGKRMKAGASEIQNMSNFGDEELKGTMTNLLMVTKNYNAALDGTQIAADLAARRNISLEQATQMLGMAYVGNTARLKQYGIVIADGVKGMEALEAIGRDVAGGAAENIKPFEQLKNAVSDLGESLGGPLVKSAYAFATAAKDNVNALIKFNEATGGAATKGLQYTAAITGLAAGIIFLTPKIQGAVTATKALTAVMAANPFLAAAAGLTVLTTVIADLGVKYMDNASTQAGVNARTDTMIEKTKSLIAEKERLLKSIGEENQQSADYIKTQEMINMLKKELIGHEAHLAQQRKQNKADTDAGGGGGESPAAWKSLESGIQEHFTVMGISTENFTTEQVEMYNQMYLTRDEMDRAHTDRYMQQLAESQAQEIAMTTATAEERAAIESMYEQQRLSGLSEMFGDISTIMNAGSRNMFEIGKAAAIAQAIVDTYSSAQSAYSSLVSIPVVGPVLGIAAAAAAVTAGTMRVTQIQSTQFQPKQTSVAYGGGAAEGVYDFRSPGNNETLMTTIRDGESIVPRKFTDAMRTEGMSFTGGKNITLQLNINGDIFGMPKDEFYRETAQRYNEMIQSGDIPAGQFTGANT